MYKPGSKYKKGKTPGGKFVTKLSRRNYSGPYLEMSDGTYFMGNNINNLGGEIIKTSEDPGKLGRTRDCSIYNILKEDYFEFISKTKDIVATKSIPTKPDYLKGFYDRYFAKRRNEILGYIEIDQKTYDSLNNKKPEYDWHLYDYGKIKWALSGNIGNTNIKSIENTERKFKGVGVIFPNIEEFYLPPIVHAPKTQTSTIESSKTAPIFNKTRESSPDSDRKANIPALKQVQESMLRDIQDKHRKKQDQISHKLVELRTPTRIEQLNEGSSGAGGASGGGTSGGGGGGY
tara:strand:+ start:496 stop:1362 length:867 start_codon:yes stop_codon:yes gene_type:complete